MGRASIRGKQRLVYRIRESGLLVPVEGLGNKELRKKELIRSLELYRSWKDRLRKKYDELFDGSEFTKNVKYVYVKTPLGSPEDPDEKIVGYYDHKCEEGISREKIEYLRSMGIQNAWASRKYVPKDSRRGSIVFDFNCDEKHLSLLRKLDRINRLSQQVVKIIDALSHEIYKLKDS